MSADIQQAPRSGGWSQEHQYPAPGPQSGYSSPAMIPFRPYDDDDEIRSGPGGPGSSAIQNSRQARYQPYPMPVQQVPSLQPRLRRPETPTNASTSHDSHSLSTSAAHYSPSAAQLYEHAQLLAQRNNSQPLDPSLPTPPSAEDLIASSAGVRLPPIMQVEKQQVTTSATQAASAGRRKNEAQFQCPVPGCGSTFTRRFNLRGTIRN